MTALLLLLTVGAIDVRTDSCGSAEELRQEVRSRLGREPDGHARFQVDISRRGQNLEATLVTTRAAGTSRRAFSSSDCRELLESLALAISIALDPALLLAPPAPPPPAASPPPAPAPVASPPPSPLPVAPSAPVASPSAPVTPSIALVGAAALGNEGPIAGVLGLSAGLARGPWWLALEGRLGLPVRFVSPLGTVSAYSILGTLSPGWQHRWVRLTLPLTVGGLFVTGGGEAPVRDSRVVVLAGLEAALRLAVMEWMHLEPFARAQLAATRVRVLSGTETLWLTWPVSFTGGLAVRFVLPRAS